MPTQIESQPRTQKVATALKDFRVTSLDGLLALAELNRRVVAGVIELSSSAAMESVRAIADMQSAVVDAIRPQPEPKVELRDVTAEAKDDRGAPVSDPLGWYRRGIESAVTGAQRVVKLLEKNGEIMARNAEHTQASAERASKEIREALDVYVEKMRKIYSRN